MPIEAGSAAARSTRKRYQPIPGEPGVWSTSYIGARPSDGNARPEDANSVYPVAYLVEFDADTLIKPHFHAADQFQLVVGGGGAFGKRSLAAVSFHYSSAYTAYGPIRAGADGLSYFTLRNGWDAGAQWMPQNRDVMLAAKRPQREVVVPPGAQETGERTDMLATADGLAASIYRMAPGGSVAGPDPREGNGQFWIVLDGSIEGQGSALDRWSCVWVSPQEPPYRATASGGAAEVIMVQFPLPARAAQGN